MNPHDQTNNLTLFSEKSENVLFLTHVDSQGQWRPFWKCRNMWHIRKMLLMLLYSVQSLTVLTFFFFFFFFFAFELWLQLTFTWCILAPIEKTKQNETKQNKTKQKKNKKQKKIL